ncbi:peptidyl-tRNA hydrolase [Pontibacillus halophilus JSM 076056 = DSM 19796]|uniref:Peptidyl-tRNA hydrolase n=1 Tax=Pontibacillus halophilus JSM 076056 = DSM 19796 TaxID=1385510 RepID=A0A0A5GA91_9BACI|nr:aminoacyl-tRNA hydrolase [Pontibacillus halophilus]KGX90081.1 peptidyl-tRNA hydrolase [Pontibacillus halophilus JSM 076056 = DSM 19796]
MKLIVGLGNPGPKFDQTRHNIGFMAIDELVSRQNWKLNKEKFKGVYTVERLNGEKVIIVKPMTYMNLSGECVRPLMEYYDLEPEDVVVIYDDMDLPTGKVRLRQKGGHGGHNGIRSMIDQLGTKEFNRIRLGIGKPTAPMSVTDYVLGKFDGEEQKFVSEAVVKAAEACEAWTDKSFLEVMNTFNQ